MRSTSSSICSTREGAPPCSGPDSAPTAPDSAAAASAPVEAIDPGGEGGGVHAVLGGRDPVGVDRLHVLGVGLAAPADQETLRDRRSPCRPPSAEPADGRCRARTAPRTTAPSRRRAPDRCGPGRRRCRSAAGVPTRARASPELPVRRRAGRRCAPSAATDRPAAGRAGTRRPRAGPTPARRARCRPGPRCRRRGSGARCPSLSGSAISVANATTPSRPERTWSSVTVAMALRLAASC